MQNKPSKLEWHPVYGSNPIIHLLSCPLQWKALHKNSSPLEWLHSYSYACPLQFWVACLMNSLVGCMNKLKFKPPLMLAYIWTSTNSNRMIFEKFQWLLYTTVDSQLQLKLHIKFSISIAIHSKTLQKSKIPSFSKKCCIVYIQSTKRFGIRWNQASQAQATKRDPNLKPSESNPQINLL